MELAQRQTYRPTGQKESSEINSHIYTVNCSSTRVPRTHIGERMVSSTNGGKKKYPQAKE